MRYIGEISLTILAKNVFEQYQERSPSPNFVVSVGRKKSAELAELEVFIDVSLNRRIHQRRLEIVERKKMKW